MLHLSPATLDQLNVDAAAGFAEAARADLAERYPHLLPRFPIDMQRAIVANMFGRAERWGLREQGGVMSYFDAMLELGAQFDAEAEVEAAVARAPTPDEGMRWLGRLLRPQTLARLADMPGRIGLFIPKSLDGEPATERIRSALDIVLWDQAPDAREEACQYGLDRAGRFDVTLNDDAGLAMTACAGLYGKAFTTAKLSWSADIFGKGLHPAAILGGLRVRAALDWGRVV